MVPILILHTKDSLHNRINRGLPELLVAGRHKKEAELTTLVPLHSGTLDEVWALVVIAITAWIGKVSGSNERSVSENDTWQHALKPASVARTQLYNAHAGTVHGRKDKTTS
jgi:hypothetical protein